jgi:hypothetical protein
VYQIFKVLMIPLFALLKSDLFVDLPGERRLEHPQDDQQGKKGGDSDEVDGCAVSLLEASAEEDVRKCEQGGSVYESVFVPKIALDAKQMTDERSKSSGTENRQCCRRRSSL